MFGSVGTNPSNENNTNVLPLTSIPIPTKSKVKNFTEGIQGIRSISSRHLSKNLKPTKLSTKPIKRSSSNRELYKRRFSVELKKKETKIENTSPRGKVIYIKELLPSALPEGCYLTKDPSAAASDFLEDLKVYSKISDYYIKQFVRRFPKCGETHCHLTGAILPEQYREYAAKRGMFFNKHTCMFYSKKESENFPEKIIQLEKVVATWKKKELEFQEQWSKLTNSKETKEAPSKTHKKTEKSQKKKSKKQSRKKITKVIKERAEARLMYEETSRKLDQLKTAFLIPTTEIINHPDLKELYDVHTKMPDGKVLYKEFFKKFDVIESISDKTPLDWLIENILSKMEKEGTIYQEVSKGFEAIFQNDEQRAKFRVKFPKDDDMSKGDISVELDRQLEAISPVVQRSVKKWKKYIEKGIEQLNKKTSSKDVLTSFDGKKVIRINTDLNRMQDLSDFFADVAVAFALYFEFEEGKVLSGIVISGPEHGLKSIMYLESQIKILEYFYNKYFGETRKLEKHRLKSELPLSIHAGELNERLFNSSQRSEELIQKVLDMKPRPKRVGHLVAGKFMNRDFISKLIDNICVEACLTSNEVLLGIEGESHPFAAFLNANVPMTLNTDDPGLFLNNLNTEFEKAIERYELTYEQLKTLSRNQLRYAFIPGDEIFVGKGKETLKECFMLCGDKENWKPNEDAMGILESSPRARLQVKLEQLFYAFENVDIPQLEDELSQIPTADKFSLFSVNSHKSQKY